MKTQRKFLSTAELGPETEHCWLCTEENTWVAYWTGRQLYRPPSEKGYSRSIGQITTEFGLNGWVEPLNGEIPLSWINTFSEREMIYILREVLQLTEDLHHHGFAVGKLDKDHITLDRHTGAVRLIGLGSSPGSFSIDWASLQAIAGETPLPQLIVHNQPPHTLLNKLSQCPSPKTICSTSLCFEPAIELLEIGGDEDQTDQRGLLEFGNSETSPEQTRRIGSLNPLDELQAEISKWLETEVTLRAPEKKLKPKLALYLGIAPREHDEHTAIQHHPQQESTQTELTLSESTQVVPQSSSKGTRIILLLVLFGALTAILLTAILLS